MFTRIVAITGYELGNAHPSLDVIAKLRKEFDTDWNTLLNKT